MKFKNFYIIIYILLLIGNIDAQERNSRQSRAEKETSLQKTASIDEWAFNVITVNQLGQTVTNIGQFHPFGGVYPTGRWPIGTDHDQIYKMNFYVGIPGNVVSTRAGNTEEWDPIAGYNNPDSGKVAISSDKNTWPKDEQGNPYWPVRTKDDQDSIVSQEDTYTVYNDSTNNRALENGDDSQRLNIRVEQSTYAWSTSKDQDYIIMKFEMTNDDEESRDSLYFAMYTDFDAGGISEDYQDDLWGFEKDRELFYIYDSDNISNDWGAEAKPFYLGLVFLETSATIDGETGLTDWHYSSDGDSPWGDLLSEDEILYQWMSSDPKLKDNSSWPNLFHGDDINYDDVSLIDPNGERLDAIASTGPYNLQPGEKIIFICALVAGEDYQDMSTNVDRVYEVYNNGIQVVPPPKPELSASAMDGKIQLSWSNDIEYDYTEPNSNKTLLKEYRIYKTQDPQRNDWGEPYKIIQVDTTKQIGENYTWTDTEGVNDYFYYSYSVTTMDQDSLESGRAFLPSDKNINENTAELRPVDSPRNSLDEVKVVPNPYIISATWERKRLGDPLLGEPIRDLAFINLPGECTIEIYTLDGDLVKEIRHNDGTGTEFWDIRSNYNQLLSTGVYFYYIESKVGEKIGKFAIVR
jgi:hypothetical protein